MMNSSAKIRAALAVVMVASSTASKAGGITIVSNHKILAAQSTIEQAEAGDYSGLNFVPVWVCSCGTYTQPPNNSPPGTQVVNIPPGDGESGFYKLTFTLPSGFGLAMMTVSANIDDVGHAYLNGLEFGSFDEYGSYTATISSGFVAGTNTLVFSDINSGGGPSGAAFWVSISYGASGPRL